MTKNFLFEPILNIVYTTMLRDNLLNSVCLELFEYVKRENVKPVIIHVVENFREKLEEISYVDTFQSLILRYDQMQGYNAEADTTLFSQDSDGNPHRTSVNGNQRWQGVKEMDAAEEAYFNTSDDEDELANKKAATKRPPMSNGVPQAARSLVDYPDDEEESLDGQVGVMERMPIERLNAQAADENTKSGIPVASTPPLERLSEKRRREEDDEEDELGKLSTTKRRSSSVSSVSSEVSIGSNSSNVLRRKKGFPSSGKETMAGSNEKIKISLAGRTSADGEGKRDEGG